jgi:hypothetical protein
MRTSAQGQPQGFAAAPELSAASEWAANVPRTCFSLQTAVGPLSLPHWQLFVSPRPQRHVIEKPRMQDLITVKFINLNSTDREFKTNQMQVIMKFLFYL